VGYQDEVWWSRFAQPSMHSWVQEGEALRLVEHEPDKVGKEDPDPKALCCYGLLREDSNKVMLRFVDGRAVSAVTIAYLEWVCERLAVEGKRVLVMVWVWDNAPWHLSRVVREWLRAHNRRALALRRMGMRGVQIVPCWLPSKSPWLNNIEPRWVHGKRAIVEPTGTLTAQELERRVCSYFDCDMLDHLAQLSA
jgi:DDE superfamily endonuclease